MLNLTGINMLLFRIMFSLFCPRTCLISRGMQQVHSCPHICHCQTRIDVAVQKKMEQQFTFEITPNNKGSLLWICAYKYFNWKYCVWGWSSAPPGTHSEHVYAWLWILDPSLSLVFFFFGKIAVDKSRTPRLRFSLVDPAVVHKNYVVLK